MADRPSTDIRIVDQFDLEVFWERHRNKIVPMIGGLVIVLIALFLWQKQAARRAETSFTRLAGAADPKSLEEVIRDFPRTEAAAQALLKLAGVQYQKGQYAEAAGAFQRFLDQFPNHPLVESAQVGLASVKEAQGDYAAARNEYLRIVSLYPHGYATLEARMGVARCTEVLGDSAQARQRYEEVMAQAQGTPWYSAAYLRWTILGRTAGSPTTNPPPPSTSATIPPPQPAAAAPAPVPQPK